VAPPPYKTQNVNLKTAIKAIKMVQVLKSAQDFELFGGFKPWHRQGEHSNIQKRRRLWADAPFSTPHLLFLG
jgi:hypothetical protein